MSRIRSVSARAAIVLALGLAAGIAFSSPAAAHSAIIDSTPKAGEEIESAPEFFSITANEDLADITGAGEGFALKVVEVATGEDVATGQLIIDGPTLSSPGVPLAPGAYVMQYQVVSADGHPVSGEVPFTVAGDAATSPAEPSNGDPGDPAAEPPLWPVWLAVSIALALVVVGLIVAIRRRR
ncbi:MAG TPA: copper resistance protein CopC [Microbacteriaceae bacterium]|nr:copper resistance protein CopC [Microbacteriaceae bacterium]